MPSGAIRVVIADDHEMVRHGFRMVLEAQPDLRVVGEAKDGSVALEQVRRLRPDVLVTDVRMPGLDGIELSRMVADDAKLETRVVVVTAFNNDDYVASALQHGACGFLLKKSAAALLVSAVRAALAGDTMISPEVTVRLLQRLQRPTLPGDRLGSLSTREREVAALLAKGLSNQEIASELYITAGTVKTHVANVSAKLGTANRIGIAVWAWETGLVSRW